METTSAAALRVAFITYEYPPHVQGGAGTYAHLLTDALANLGHSITVFTPNGSNSTSPGLRVCQVSPGSSGAIPFWRHLPAAFRQEVQRNGHFDIVHGSAVADLPLCRRICNSPRINTVHHIARTLIKPGATGILARAHDIRGETGLPPLIEGFVMHRADRVIAISDSTRDDIRKAYRLRNDLISVIPNGLASAESLNDRMVKHLRSALCPNGELLILAIGRLECRKGTDILIRAFSSVKSAIPLSVLALAGSGPIGTFRALAERLGIERHICFLGPVTNGMRNHLYGACDVFVLASRLEGFGFVSFEAMSYGRPVVVTNTGAALSGLIKPQNGAVVPVDNAYAIAQALVPLLQNESLRREIGAFNKRYVEGQLSWSAAAKLTVNVYRRAISGQSAQSLHEATS